MRKTETQLSEKGLTPEFILVTFDPKRDTPSHLKNYRTQIGVTERQWHFLSGSEADTRSLSMLLGIKFAKDPESGEIMHDNKLILISPTGEIRAKLNSLSENDSDLIEAITTKKGEPK
jgi:protein SCO1/2